MTAKKVSSRKRSRPIEKRRKTNPNVKTVIILVAIIAAVAIAAVSVYILLPNISSANGNQSNNNSSSGGNPIAVINTSMGTIKVELYHDKMPETCENFIKLVNDGFYDGMIFYRVSKGFMIQAGRYLPDGSERQSPYGNINFEESDVKHIDGAISMASTGSKVGGSAEFFICDGEQKGLDGRYAAFGATIEGLDVVHNIAAQPQDNSNPAGGGKPYTDIIINKITIENQ